MLPASSSVYLPQQGNSFLLDKHLPRCRSCRHSCRRECCVVERARERERVPRSMLFLHVGFFMPHHMLNSCDARRPSTPRSLAADPSAGRAQSRLARRASDILRIARTLGSSFNDCISAILLRLRSRCLSSCSRVAGGLAVVRIVVIFEVCEVRLRVSNAFIPPIFVSMNRVIDASRSNQWTPLGLILTRLDPVHICIAAQVSPQATACQARHSHSI